MFTRSAILSLAAMMLASAMMGCGGKGGGAAAPSGAKGTPDEAKALLQDFMKAGADHAGMTKKLRPAKADFEAVFEGDYPAKAQAAYDPDWDAGRAVIKPNEGQTELRVWSATTEEIRDWTGDAAKQFPGGYKEFGANLKPKLTWYRFKFVKPGEDLGMAYDGLVFVNGNWRIFPKPWRLAAK